jgi:hypothetical protein
MGVESSEARESLNNLAAGVLGALRYLGDISYAILPREMAHSLADLKKSFWNCVRSAVDKEVEWIDERVAGGDRLRAEWRKSSSTSENTGGAGGPVN